MSSNDIIYFSLFQVLFIFLQNMNLLLSKTPQNDIRNYILPLLYRALESNAPPVQVS